MNSLLKLLSGIGLAAITVAAHASDGETDNTPTHVSAEAGDTRDECMARAMREASPYKTLGEIRATCRALKGTSDTGLQSPVRARFISDVGLMIDRLGFLPHRPNFMLPFAWGENFNTLGNSVDPVEVKFQLSLKLPFTIPSQRDKTDTPILFFAYTGSAWWQAYNSDRSSPFREYNHSPEVFMLLPVNKTYLGWTARAVEFGFEHHSNGRDGAESRSWNRLFAQVSMDRNLEWWASLRAWWRIPESAKDDPTSAEGDDNPDIERFYGNFALLFGRNTPRGFNWNLLLRQSFKSGGKGAAELTLSYPTRFNTRARWHIRLFEGYGESLIDYNRRVTRIGFGMMLNDWY